MSLFNLIGRHCLSNWKGFTRFEFPSFDMAMACWNSQEYLEAKAYRVGGGDLNVVKDLEAEL